MISLLHLLHAIAAERGDGLHPELRKHLSAIEAGTSASLKMADKAVSENDRLRAMQTESAPEVSALHDLQPSK